MSKEIELTQGQVAIVDDEDYGRVIAYQWRALWDAKRNSFGTETCIRTDKGEKRLQLSRFVMNAPKGVQVQFLDGDELNCRRSNLRIVTRSQNSQGLRTPKSNTSGYKGVSWCKQTGRWQASIVMHGTTKKLGRFDDLIEAAHAYDAAARKHFGKFARLNFPKEGEAAASDVVPSHQRVAPVQTTYFPRRHKSNSRSEYKGVYSSGPHRWQASIWVNKKMKYLGIFDSELEAAHAYDDAAREHFGAFARLNFPKPGEMPARPVRPLKPAA